MENKSEVFIAEQETEEKHINFDKIMKTEVKPRRVGTITVGICMVAFGVMFLLCSVFEVMKYQAVFALWPLILIALGVEILVYSCFKGKLIYDKGSVFIMIIMLFLSAGMAMIDVCWKTAELYMSHL